MLKTGLATYAEACREMVEAALDGYVQPRSSTARLVECMRYSLLAGGKRLRAMLVLAAAELCGARPEVALPAACAVEMVHTSSLIHDDLPAMDDGDVRRGRPANHRVYGEAMAILAGDALFTCAFELLASMADDPRVGPERANAAARELAQALGLSGLVAGQVLDLHYAGQPVTAEALAEVHHRKTGALIRGALRIGATCAAASPTALAALTAYGEHLGLAFQIQDDVLGVVGDAVVLGKPVGSDTRQGKATYTRLLGVEQARLLAVREAAAAIQALHGFSDAAGVLVQLAEYAVRRDR